jgi:sugar lactone lactonase YvrE
MSDMSGTFRYCFILVVMLLIASCDAGSGPAAEPVPTDVSSPVPPTITPQSATPNGDIATIQAIASLIPVNPSRAPIAPTATQARTPTSAPTAVPTATTRPASTTTPAPHTIGRGGAGNGEFAYPTGIVVTANAIYVADRDNGRVQRLTLQGEFVWKTGTPGSSLGQLSVPSGIAVFNKILYVADTGNKRVSVFNAETGAFVRVFGEQGTDYNQLAGPYGIALDSAGHVFVSDKGNFRIQVYDTNDSPLRMSGSGGGAQGNFSGVGPAGIVVDTNDTLFVADTSRDLIDMFDVRGKYIGLFGGSGTSPGRLKAPVGVAVDKQGRIIVADRDNMRVSIFGPDGRFIGVKLAGETAEPTFVAVDAAGVIYVTDVKNNRVVILQ